MNIVKDYETKNKPIKDIFNNFNSNYRIPINLLDEVMKCKYLNYYYSQEELNEYYTFWLSKITNSASIYSIDQYKLYNEITLENVNIDNIQVDHYLDEGCQCKACLLKRKELAYKINLGKNVTERVNHIEAKTQLINKRSIQINQLNNQLNNLINNIKSKKQPKNFNKDMKNIISNNLR
jgi:hypothetical protein